MANIKDAVKTLTSSYGDINAEARSWNFSAKEVDAELAKAKPDTAEYVVLNLLKNSVVNDTIVNTVKDTIKPDAIDTKESEV
ncbi:hypothetical protein EB001_14750 [bacterium]|nr:hypothetical protein [bacterium]